MQNLSPEVKKMLFGGLLILVICLTILGSNLLIASRPIYVQNNTGLDGKPVNNINVAAVGKVIVKPDIATFTAGYTIKKDDISSLQKDLNEKNNAMLAVLKSKNIADKDITTATFDINPIYRYESQSGRQINDGYQGTIRINVKIRNLDKLGEAIDTVVDAGANVIDNIAFTVDDLEKVKVEARILAAQAAKAKAQVLAESSGAALGGLISITEDVQGYSNPVSYNMVKSTADESSSQAPTISAGSLEITITVQATYAIK